MEPLYNRAMGSLSANTKRIWCAALALLLLAAHAVSFPETLAQPTASEATNACGFSDQIYAQDVLLRKSPKAPTHFRLMVSRYISMVEAMRGYRCTGTVTVGFDGHHYFQTAMGDDPGIMELIPTLSRLSGMSVANTYDVTIMVVIAAGLLIGYAGFWKLHPQPSARTARWLGAAAFLLLGLVEARVADEYIFQVSPLIAGVPWLYYLALRRDSLALTASAVVLAFYCSCCSLARAGTIAVCASFLIATVVLRYRIREALLPVLLLAVACVPPVLFEQSLIARRNQALARVGVTATAPDSHIVWATAYIGLGFIANSEVPEYRDGVGAKMVQSIDPTVAYASAKFETIVRDQLWSIVKRRPMIVVENLAAKVGIVALLGAFLLFPARKFMFAEAEVMWFDIAFLVTAAVSAINAIVAIPRLCYLLTFSCLCVLYATIKVCRALTQRVSGV